MIGIAALPWLLLLAFPMGRVNLLQQALHTGSRFPTDAEAGSVYTTLFDDGSICADNLPWPDAARIHREFPHDPEVQFGLPVGSAQEQERSLDGLIASHPHNASYLAIRLICSLGRLKMGRQDNPYSDPDWPRPNHDPNFVEEVPSPPANWLLFLSLAQRGAALEPQNTFFDWMRITALLALHRDPEALQVLHGTAGKSGYDEHLREYRLALWHALRLARPLTPAEQLNLQPATTPDSFLIRVAHCIMGQVITERWRHQDGAAVATAYQLLCLGRLIRTHSYSVDRAYIGLVVVEEAAMDEVALLPPSKTRSRFARLPSPSGMLRSSSNLAGYAWLTGDRRVAADVVAERAILHAWNPLLIASLAGRPGGWWATAASLQERWGRMLLRTLPPCFLLLLLATVATRCRPNGNGTSLLPARYGPMIGGTLLALLVAGDLGRCWRTQIDKLGFVAPTAFAQAHGVLALMPVLTTLLIPGVFILLSFAHARQLQLCGQKPPRWTNSEAGRLPSPRHLAEFNSRPLVALTARITLWTSLVAGFFFVCLDGNAYPLERDGWLFHYADAIAIGIWSAFLIAAFYRWYRLPDRRRALALAGHSLRQLTAGYVLAALLIYPLMALLILPVDGKFDRIYHEAVQVGEAGMVRQELGL